MLVNSLVFDCRFIEDTRLPLFKGSTLRGAFGHSLKKISCALCQKNCQDCFLTATCCYSLVFESGNLYRNGTRYQNRPDSKPHPFVLDPPDEGRTHYAAGEHFSFAIQLFGPALQFRPQILYAVITMGENGLGMDRQGKFAVCSIQAGDTCIYDEERKEISMEALHEAVTLNPVSAKTENLTIHLITPFRVKRDNRFQDTLPFSTLARTALRRVSSLENAYGDGEPDINYSQLARDAEEIKTVNSELEWVDIKRYSSRQQKAMLLGGLKGKIHYQGKIAPFLPLLQYCEKTNLGKQTTFGLGKIMLQTD